MTTAVEEMRAKVREAKDEVKAKRRKKVWTPPDPGRFRHETILAMDQTLTHTGWAVIESTYEGLTLLMADCIDVRTDLVGFEGTFAKAHEMERRIRGVVGATTVVATTVVHEMPAVGGHRTESSLIGALLIRQVMQQHRGVGVAMVSNLAMKALLCAPGERDEKKHVKAAVEGLIPKERRNRTRRWNEHVHDAVALGLTHLYEPEERQ